MSPSSAPRWKSHDSRTIVDTSGAAGQLQPQSAASAPREAMALDSSILLLDSIAPAYPSASPHTQDTRDFGASPYKSKWDQLAVAVEGPTLEIVSRVGASVPPLPLLASLAAVPLKAADESGPRTSRCIHCRCCNDCTATRLNARQGSSSSATMWTCKPAPHRGQVQLRLRVQSRVPRRRQGGKKRNGHARRCSCFLWLAAVLKGFRAACTQSLRRMEWSQLRKS